MFGMGPQTFSQTTSIDIFNEYGNTRASLKKTVGKEKLILTTNH